MSGAPNLRRVPRQVVAPDSVVGVGRLTGLQFPPVMTPNVAGIELAEWASLNSEAVEGQVREHGGLLLRGFDVPTTEVFHDFVTAVYRELAEYNDQTTPRTSVGEQVYTSTEYPANQVIDQHSEMSYAREAPARIMFYSVIPAQEGGETPLADNRAVLRSLPEEVRDTFVDKGVMYIRNYREELGLPWQTAFQTDDRGEVEERFRRQDMDFEWTADGGLRLRHLGPAVISHPGTGEPVWFNQADMFHTSSLPAQVREALLANFAEEDAPNHACFGDGSPIPEEWLAEVRRAYEEAQVMFPWERGDILVLDNPLVTHGRMPFKGERKVLVAMAEPFQVADFELERVGAVRSAD
ncbi:MAG: TauD/TfdA family dioxygenase [Solirubrobacteraceae bacterium]